MRGVADLDADRAIDGFGALDLDPRLLSTIAALGYEEPTPIQREAIPPLLAGRDLLAEAPTGTGKTAAFALPTLQRIPIGTAGDGPHVGARAGPDPRARDAGRGGAPRIRPRDGRPGPARLRRPADRPAAARAPARAWMSSSRRPAARSTTSSAAACARRVQVVVLDEADEMLDMGFAEDLETILAATPTDRQTALFSATISPTITRIAKRHLRDPARIKVHAEKVDGDGVARVRQVAYVVRRSGQAARPVPHPRRRGPDLGPGVRADARRGGRPCRGPQRARPRRRRAPRRAHPGSPRPDDGPLPRRIARRARGHRRRGARPRHRARLARRQLRRALEPRRVRPPHRADRPGRAARASAITLVEPREHRLLRNIEAATRSKLQIAHLPTVADLRERRTEILRANLREALVGDDLDRSGRRRAADRRVRPGRHRARRGEPGRGPAGGDAEEVELSSPPLAARAAARAADPPAGAGVAAH